METWKLYVIVLLPFTIGSSRKEVLWKSLVKSIGQEPDDTPICSNDTLNYVLLIVCRINMKMSRGEECLLHYRRMQGFHQGCGSKFTLVTINQTVFLHLNNLTPEDSGIYSCQCTHPEGTDSIQINITVEENEDAASSSETPSSDGVTGVVVSGVAVVMIIAGVMLLVVYRKICHRKREVTITQPTTEIENIEPYSVFMQRENGLYMTSIINNCSNTNI